MTESANKGVTSLQLANGKGCVMWLRESEEVGFVEAVGYGVRVADRRTPSKFPQPREQKKRKQGGKSLSRHLLYCSLVCLINEVLSNELPGGGGRGRTCSSPLPTGPPSPGMLTDVPTYRVRVAWQTNMSTRHVYQIFENERTMR